jgi:tetratricopeptide (TPR) repeat protein
MNTPLFISRAGADEAFAAVVGEILQAAGYEVILQQWDFANRNFVERMDAALAEGARVVALLSHEYLSSDHCKAEWQNAIASDPLNTTSRLVLLRVTECEPLGLLSGLAYWDLVPVRDNRELLRGIVLDAVREEQRDRAASGPYWRAPRCVVDTEAIRPAPGFSGREDELTDIATAFSGGETVAVCGLGGVGKSSVAREFAWRHRDEYSVVWWLNAQSDDTIIEGLLRLGAIFIRGFERLSDRRAAARQVIDSLLAGFSKPALLVFDNVEDERLLRAWMPTANARTLATSRNATYGADVTAIALHVFDLDRAAAYLIRESGRPDLTRGDAAAIVEALGGLPLALAHAAASLRGMRMLAPRSYLDRIADHLKRAPAGVEYPRSVFATFTTAIGRAEAEAPGATAVLCFAACFAPNAIPDELFRQQPVDCGDEELQRAFSYEVLLDEALGALDRLSLLAFSEASRSYSIHRLVRIAAHDMLADKLVSWAEVATEVLDIVFPPVEFASWLQCERILPHAIAVLNALPADSAFLPAGRVADRCGFYLRERGDYRSAEPLQVRALAILERALSPDDPELAVAVRDLAVLYNLQARYREAEPLHLRALAIQETALGLDDPEVARTLNNLGNLCYEEGRLEEAGLHFFQALGIREKALGPDHPRLATSLNNVAFIYSEQGRNDEAEPLLLRAIDIIERVSGPDHPDVAMSLHNLANVYYELGIREKPEPLHIKGLGIREKALGPEHPDVAKSLTDLARFYWRERRYRESEPLNLRALSLRERMLGPDHPEVAITLNDLALLYESLGRLGEAVQLLTRALTIRESRMGADHPATRALRARLVDIQTAASRRTKENGP